jgi:hypothetical protein
MFDYELLSSEFDEIIEKRNIIKEKYKMLEGKLTIMKAKYSSLIQNNQKKMFIYCLDSFFFQYKILLLELEHYEQVIKSVSNRMYGDYYKLFMVIIEKCKETAFEIEGLNNMENIPSYKDVDANVEYKIDDLLKLHNNILAVLKQLATYYEKRNTELKSQDESSDIGFSITSFLDTLGYENRLIYEQINLYNSYLQFYHSSQNGYLDKTLAKMETFAGDIDKEVLVNHKNVKTKSMAKFNMIKKRFNSGTLMDKLKSSGAVEVTPTLEKEPINVHEKDPTNILEENEGSSSEELDVNQVSSKNDDIIVQDE